MFFLLHHAKRPLDAKPIAEKAVELDPKNSDASLTLALIHYELNDLNAGDKAINVAKK
ncbi:tetratricopeptide repeat protein [Undibacterium arcticum]